MTLVIDFPDCSRSLVGQFDPRWKIVGLLSAAFGTTLLHDLPPALVAGAGAILLSLLARLPFKWLMVKLATILAVMSFFLVWLPFVHVTDGARWDLGVLTLAPDGLRLAALILLKAVTVFTLMVVLLASAPLQETLKAAHALHVPGPLVHLVQLAYRFVFVVADEFSRLRTALRVRAFHNRPNWHSYRTVGQVAGTLLVRSHDRAERVAQAMRCRGFDGCFRSLHDFRTGWTDVIAFALIVGTTAALLGWDHLRD